MVNKCSCRGCFTNFEGFERGSVFALPKKDELRKQWIKFINRKEVDVYSFKYIFICEKHFEGKYLNRNGVRTRLIASMNPIPTVLSESQLNLPRSAQPTIIKQRKPPAERMVQQDEHELFFNNDRIFNFLQLNETFLETLGDNFHFKRYNTHVAFYKLKFDDLPAPKVTVCICVDSDLHVKLYYQGNRVPLPAWFRYGTQAKLTSRSMLENFPNYVENEYEKHGFILEELNNLQFIKRNPVYSANMIRYALMLRYSSLATYKLLLHEFNLPSISFLRKLTSGKIDAMTSAKLLNSHGKISEDVILMFDEIYLQKCEEFQGGESFGADDAGELYKGLVSFMIVGLKSSVPFIVNAVPEKEISGEWLKREILKRIQQLQECSFNVRGVVCDDHPTNVSAYKKLLTDFGNSTDDLFITINAKKIYLFFDTVHLVKNIRNNLLNRKRFLFPEFSFGDFYDNIKVKGGEVSWRILHQVYEKDSSLQAHLKAAPMLSAKVLHPGNCKQSVPVALAIFDPTTVAAIRTYFPVSEDAASFLSLIHIWWTISNAKVKENSSHHLGNAAKKGDNKPKFLRAFAQWLKEWEHSSRIANFEKFSLSSQTSQALQRTLLSHASLIEDLLVDGFNFVLTARFQSDPLERRYGQYRQMSGGRFLVSLRDIHVSEKIVKIKSLVQEGFDINDNIKVHQDHHHSIQKLLADFEEAVLNSNLQITLEDDSKEVSNYVAGYISHKMKKHCDECCSENLIQRKDCQPNKPATSYISLVSRGGLSFASSEMKEYVAESFAHLDASSALIRKSGIPERLAGEEILKTLSRPSLFCKEHEKVHIVRVDRIISNVFFNNQRKRTTESVVIDRVVAFKRSKRNI